MPPYFWEDVAHRRDYLLWSARRFGLRTMRDLYRLDLKAVFGKHRGSGLNKYWGHLPLAAVQDCLPKYDWKAWLFVQVPYGFWESPVNRRSYLDWLGNELGFRKPNDWYRIQTEDIRNRYGRSLLLLFPSLYDILREYLPQLNWDRVDLHRQLTIEEILALADAHHAAHGTWPTSESIAIPERGNRGNTWRAIDRCLKEGFRGLPGGSTLLGFSKNTVAAK